MQVIKKLQKTLCFIFLHLSFSTPNFSSRIFSCSVRLFRLPKLSNDPKISAPTCVTHDIHVVFDASTGEFRVCAPYSLNEFPHLLSFAIYFIVLICFCFFSYSLHRWYVRYLLNWWRGTSHCYIHMIPCTL